MGIRYGLCLAAVGSTLLALAGGARADEQSAGGGGGGKLVGVGTTDQVEVELGPTPARAAPARAVAVAYARPENRLPIAYVDRGITNPAFILTPEIDFSILHVDVLGGGGGGLNLDPIGFGSLGAGYSITDDLGVRVTAFSLQFNEPAQLAGAAFGFTYRFLRGNFEMGVGADWIYQTPSNPGIDTVISPGQDIIPSLPMHVHFGHAARLDITPSLPISTAGVYLPGIGGVGGGRTTVGFDVPLEVLFQLVEQLHLGVGTGLNMVFNPDSSIPNTQFGDFFGIPFGFELGATVAGGSRGPILDMTPFFYWPELLVPGIRNPPYNVVQSGLWTTGIKFTVFAYL